MLLIIDPKLFNPDLVYMTKLESATFKKLVEEGAISFFQISVCENCKSDILKGKKYCSIDCYKAKERGYEEEKDEEEYDE
jgi:hypothetical protein